MINKKLEAMVCELQAGKSDPLSEAVPAPLADAKRRALLDWRSFPVDHPFYQEGCQLEGTLAALLSGMYDGVSYNDDTRIFGVQPENLVFLERIQ